MLQSMRDRTQGIIAGAIALLICITFALWGVQYYLRGNRAANIVATVNGVEITQNDLRFNYERIRQQIVAKEGKKFVLDQEEQQKLKQKVLNQLIDAQILKQGEEKLGIYISDRQLQATIMQVPIFQIDGKFSVERYQEILSRMFYSESSFWQETRDTLMSTQLLSGLIGSAFVLPDEVDAALKLTNQKRDIGYSIIPPSRFFAEIKISEDDISAYYRKHQDEFMVPESISIEYVQLSADKLANQLSAVKEEVLKKFYKDNIDQYTTPRRWQIAEILLKLPENAGEKEFDAAKKNAEALIAQVKSGKAFEKLLPAQTSVAWVTEKEIDPSIAKEISKLEIGQASSPIRSRRGYSLFKLLAANPQEILSFENVKDRIVKTYTQQKLMQLFSEQNDKLSELAFTNSDSLLPAAKALNLTIQTSGVFDRKGGSSGLEQNPKIVKAAFGDLVLLQGYNSNPIEISPGNVVVIRLKKHFPAKARPLAEVRALIKQNLRMLAAQAKAKSLSDKIMAAIGQGVSPQQAAKQYGLNWKIIPNLIRKDNRVSDEIVNFAFGMQKGSVNSLALAKGGFAIVRLSDIIDGDLSQINEGQLEAAAKALQSEFGGYDYNLLANGWKRKAKVQIFEKSFTNE